MFTIAICDDNYIHASLMTDLLNDYYIDNHVLGITYTFHSAQELLDANREVDVYLLDVMMPEIDGIELGMELRRRGNRSAFIYISSDAINALKVFDVGAVYFLCRPVDTQKLFTLLDKIRKSIEGKTLIIKTSSGQRRIFRKEINYINIVRRYPSYHLWDRQAIDGQMLRGSFEKLIEPLLSDPNFYFIAPGAIINLNAINELKKDCIIFDNKEIYYFPMTQYKNIETAWLQYQGKKNTGRD